MAFGFSYSFKLPAVPTGDRFNSFMEEHRLSKESSNIPGEVLFTKSELIYDWTFSWITIWFHFGTYIRFTPKGNQVLVTLSNKVLSGLMVVVLLLIFGLFLFLPGEINTIDIVITIFLMLCVYIISGLRLLASGWYLRRRLKEM